MGRDTLIEQEDLIHDINDIVQWLYGDYGGVTAGRINRIRELLDKLEDTIDDVG